MANLLRTCAFALLFGFATVALAAPESVTLSVSNMV